MVTMLCILLTTLIMKKGYDIMSEIYNGVEVKSMSVIYAELIIQGTYTFKKVAKYFKSDTAVVLISLGAEELIGDETYIKEAKERIEKANVI
nr:MAG TPA: hypothetical protein [Caudoviricetes sp.]